MIIIIFVIIGLYIIKSYYDTNIPYNIVANDENHLLKSFLVWYAVLHGVEETEYLHSCRTIFISLDPYFIQCSWIIAMIVSNYHIKHKITYSDIFHLFFFHCIPLFSSNHTNQYYMYRGNTTSTSLPLLHVFWVNSCTIIIPQSLMKI